MSLSGMSEHQHVFIYTFSTSSDLMSRTHRSFPRWNKNEPRVRKILSISLMGKIMDQFHRSRLLDQDKIFSSGFKQFSALTTLPTKADAIHRRLNLRICPLESLPFFLLMNTGDDRLITILRKKAGDMGYNLNELAMGLPVDDKVSTDLYRDLGM